MAVDVADVVVHRVPSRTERGVLTSWIVVDNIYTRDTCQLIVLVRFGKNKLHYFSDKEYYEGHIDPNSGKDWNQIAPVDTRPTLDDFKKTISDYLAWEVSTLLKSQSSSDDCLGK